MSTNNWNWTSRISPTTTFSNLTITYTYSDIIYTYLSCTFTADIGLYNGNSITPTLPITYIGSGTNTIIVRCNNSTGNFEWYAGVGSSSGSCAINFIRTENSNIYIGGTFIGNPIFTNATSGIYTNPPSGSITNTSVFIASLDTTGVWSSIVSAKANTSTLSTNISQMKISSGYVYVSLLINDVTTLYDNTNNAAISNIPHTGSGDAIISKTDLITWQWATRIANSENNDTIQMYLSFDSAYITGTYTVSPLSFYNGNSNVATKTMSLPPATSRCVYVCKLHQLNGIINSNSYVAQVGVQSSTTISSIGFSNTSMTDFYVSYNYSLTAVFYNTNSLSASFTANNVIIPSNKLFISKINTNGIWQWFSIVTAPTSASIRSLISNGNIFVTGNTQLSTVRSFRFFNGNVEDTLLSLTGKYATNLVHLFNGVLDDNNGEWMWSNLIAPSTESSLTISYADAIINGPFVDVVYRIGRNGVFIYEGNTNNVETVDVISGTNGYNVIIKYNFSTGDFDSFKKTGSISNGVSNTFFSNNMNKYFVSGIYTSSISFYNENTEDLFLSRTGTTNNNIYIGEIGRDLNPCFAFNSIKSVELPEDAEIIYKNFENSEWIEFNDNISSPLYLTKDHLISYDNNIIFAEDTKNPTVINNDNVVDIETSDGRFITIKNVMVKTRKKQQHLIIH